MLLQLILTTLALAALATWTWRRRARARAAAELEADQVARMAGAIRASAATGAEVRAGVLERMRQALVKLKGNSHKFQLEVLWRMEAYNPDGSLRAAQDLGANLVVNAGLTALVDRMFNSATAQPVFPYIAIGTDATAETAADPALGVEVARATAAANVTAGAPGVLTLDYTFPAALGWEPATIVEAGLFDTIPAGGVMFSRKTGFSFTKTATDTLKVVAVLQVTPA